MTWVAGVASALLVAWIAWLVTRGNFKANMQLNAPLLKVGLTLEPGGQPNAPPQTKDLDVK